LPAGVTGLGDKIFPSNAPRLLSLLRHPENLPVQQRNFQTIERKCRSSVEWVIKDIMEKWKYLVYERHLQVKKTAVARDIFVCSLLTNALSLYMEIKH
jgi:hypothetical protein